MPNENNNIITKDWMDVHDAVLASKLKGLADAQIVLTLDAAPASWETYTAYTIGTGASAEVHDFKEGDEVRIPDEGALNGFSYYKLIKFTRTSSNKTATWVKIGDGAGDYRGTIKVTLQAIVNDTQASGGDLNGLTVSVQNVTDNETAIVKTWAGSELVFNQLTPMKNYLITVQTKNDTYVTKIGDNVGNTYTVASLGIAQEVSKTFQYCADEYSVAIDSNQTDKTDIANAKVIYNNTQYANASAIRVPLGTTIVVSGESQNVTATDLTSTGYSCALSLTNHVISALYSTEVLSITSVTSDKTGDDFAGVTFTVNNVTKTYGEDTLTWKVPYDVSDVITADRTGFSVTVTKTPNTNIADSVSKTATIAYEEMKNGVFAYYSNGDMKPLAQADNTAIGVAVIDDDASFVIGKNTTLLAFGGYNTVNLTGTAMVTTDSTTAKTDFDGYRNTSRIMNALKDQKGNGSNPYPETTGAPAAEWCRGQFNGKGYLPSLGEMNFAYQHKADIDAMMSKIGGTAMGTDYRHWTSTHYNTTQRSWVLSWNTGNTLNYNRYRSNYFVRAFQALKTSITLNLSATDNLSSISGQTVLVSDKLGNVQTSVSDSNGQVTFSNVACGQVFVSVKKCLVTSNRTIKVSPNNKVFTIGLSTPNVGLYYYSLDKNGNGVLSPSSATDAIGVAVVTSDCAFVIDKNDLSAAKGGTGIAWGGYNVDLSNIGVMVTTNSTTAKTDFSGEENTAKVINALYQVQGAKYDTYPATYGAPALETCTTAFNGKGYMPSLGEWNAAYQNKGTIDSMMQNISGYTAIKSGYYWGSTIYNATQGSWELNWNGGIADGGYRYNSSYYVRAFQAL